MISPVGARSQRGIALRAGGGKPRFGLCRGAETRCSACVMTHLSPWLLSHLTGEPHAGAGGTRSRASGAGASNGREAQGRRSRSPANDASRPKPPSIRGVPLDRFCPNFGH
jgi:hypothetical protein